MSNQNSVVLLTRLLSLKESSPFHLIIDSLLQSSYYLIEEYVYKLNNSIDIIYLSFETAKKPNYAKEFIDCTFIKPDEIIKKVKSVITTSKSLIIIDSLNYFENIEVTNFISTLASPTTTIIATYHINVPIPKSSIPNYPSALSLLTYIASSIFELEPILPIDINEEELENEIAKLNIPVNLKLNSPIFKCTLTNRRKSGRSIIYKFKIDTKLHEYEIIKEAQPETNEEDESLLKDLTTFNLTTSNKQKLAKEQVELPFMQAQESLGSSGGAIVYEFEKDDDYDEEDPYEDPF
ncbi:unnamed protein product [Candida verbasci]|uniref:Elongator complex protein 5 n=1 Tax=Candida verbasci TaxID=1227364 RepID=A0A9W4XMI3_9ASCO|nr:unnamed protein product [Candida verbasci]